VAVDERGTGTTTWRCAEPKTDVPVRSARCRNRVNEVMATFPPVPSRYLGWRECADAYGRNPATSINPHFRVALSFDARRDECFVAGYDGSSVLAGFGDA